MFIVPMSVTCYVPYTDGWKNNGVVKKLQRPETVTTLVLNFPAASYENFIAQHNNRLASTLQFDPIHKHFDRTMNVPYILLKLP